MGCSRHRGRLARWSHPSRADTTTSARRALRSSSRLISRAEDHALIALAGTEPRIEVTTANPLPPGWAHGVEGVRELTRQGDNGAKVSLALVRVDQAPEILRMAERDGGQVVEFYLHRPNLQDAFLALTGRALRDIP